MTAIDFLTVLGIGIFVGIFAIWLSESWLKRPRVTKIERFHKGDLEEK
jgi:hypothetical protein